MNPKTVAQLIDEVETLCGLYIGKNAESEQWGETLNRLDRIDKIVKRLSKQQKAATP